MSESNKAQADAILADLKAGHALTPQDALRKFQCFRLAARIHELRRSGHNISMELGTDGEKRWAIYRLVQSAALITLVACAAGTARAAEDPRCTAYASAVMTVLQAQASIEESVEFCRSHPTLRACAPGGSVELARKMANPPPLMSVGELCRRAAEENKKR